MPPGPHKLSCLTLPNIAARSARSRSRPMKLFGSAGRLPRLPSSPRFPAGVVSDVMGLGAQGGFHPLSHPLGSPSANDMNPHGLAVAQVTEVHNLDQCPPPLTRTGVAWN